MDRELAASVQRKSKLKRYFRVGGLVLILLVGLAGFRMFLKPTVSKATLRTAVATVGSIEASLTASGVTVPETELMITSPIQARLEKVWHRPGEKVVAGQSILQLNKEATITAFYKLKDEQQLKQNKASKLRIGLEKDLNELQAQYHIKKMQVKSLESVAADENYLLKIGGGTPENTKKAELNLQVAQLELKLLHDQIQNKKQALQADLKDLGFEIDIQNRDIQALERTMAQAEVKTDRAGVVTWVNTEIGANVNQGDVLARLADLSSFKIKASINDTYADQLQVGSPVVVRVNDTDLRGTIATIEPTVSNGVLTFYVQLQEKNHPLLRPNLQVEVFVVTAHKNNVVRVKNGPFYNGVHNQAVFVIKGDKAIRRKLEIGVSNFDFVELKNNLAAGEEVVISDMKEYQHLSEINLKD